MYFPEVNSAGTKWGLIEKMGSTSRASYDKEAAAADAANPGRPQRKARNARVALGVLGGTGAVVGAHYGAKHLVERQYSNLLHGAMNGKVKTRPANRRADSFSNTLRDKVRGKDSAVAKRLELSQTAVGRRIIEEPIAKASGYAQLRRVANPSTSTGQAIRHGMAWGRSGRTEMNGSKNEVFQQARAAGAKYKALKDRGVSKRARSFDQQDGHQRRLGALEAMAGLGGAVALHQGGRGILSASKGRKTLMRAKHHDLKLLGAGAAGLGSAGAIERYARSSSGRRYT